MAVKINFDSSGMPEVPTFILSTRNGNHIGVLNNITQIQLRKNMNSPFDSSFLVYKILNENICDLWDKIDDLKILHVPDWDKWLQISVDIEEKDNCIKNVSAVSLQEEELSQILLHEIEINTEDDIAKDDYVPTIFYDKNNVKASLLHRLLVDKANHYKIIHVDESLKKIQRSFSFDNKSIYDAFQEISEELNCIFVFGERDDSYTNIVPRTISVYDLESVCKNCGHREEFMTVCSKCGSKDIKDGYGKDTTIFISTENLAEEITYSTDVGSIKNCFRLESGDDDMDAAIINVNPSGTRYLWNIPQYMKDDMSEELVKRLGSYDRQYEYYQNDYEENLDNNIVSLYNQLILKYRVYDENLCTIVAPIKGYKSLMKVYYDVIDFKGYLQNSLTPTVKTSGISAQQQASLLKSSNLSPMSIESPNISLTTANSLVLSYAKVFIDTSRYKVKVKESNYSSTNYIWTGVFTVTSYIDEKDTADSGNVTISFNGNYENFIKQKIEKVLSKENEDLSIVGLFKKNDTNFKNELKKYSLSNLKIIYEACQSSLDIMISQGISENQSDLYNSLYKPYYDKSTWISQEIQLRENEIGIIDAIYDVDGDISSDGICSIIEKRISEISKLLDFKRYIGEYWDEFCSFRREDVWSNTNYISDGLNNKQLFENAEEFLEVAKKELIKSSTMQHKISTTLKDLLVIESFKPLVDYFSVGNWMRLSADNKIYKLRLISYEINYDSLNTISVDFSNVIQFNDVMSDIKSVLKQSQSMSSSYDSIKRQASAGDKAHKVTAGWVADGLDATATKIMNNADNQDVIFDKHGLLFREWDPDTETFSPIQSKQINSTLAYTTDNWETTKAAIGRYIYLDPKDGKYKEGYGVIADTIVGNIILGEEVGIYSSNGMMSFNENGLIVYTDEGAMRFDDEGFTVNAKDGGGFRISQDSTLIVTNGTDTFQITPDCPGGAFLGIYKNHDPIFHVYEDGSLFLNNAFLENANMEGSITSVDKTTGNWVLIKDGSIGGGTNDSNTANGAINFSTGVIKDGQRIYGINIQSDSLCFNSPLISVVNNDTAYPTYTGTFDSISGITCIKSGVNITGLVLFIDKLTYINGFLVNRTESTISI